LNTVPPQLYERVVRIPIIETFLKRSTEIAKVLMLVGARPQGLPGGTDVEPGLYFERNHNFLQAVSTGELPEHNLPE